jgi:hypothetical protein
MAGINGSGIYVELVLLCPSLLKEGYKVPLESSTTLILRTSN